MVNFAHKNGGYRTTARTPPSLADVTPRGVSDKVEQIRTSQRAYRAGNDGIRLYLSFMENSKNHGIVRDARGEDQPKDKARAQQSSKTPAAGPHAKPELTDGSKTPGAGTLPEPGESGDSTGG